MPTAADVYEFAQPLLGDPGGEQFATADWLRPYLNIAIKVFSNDVMGNPNVPQYKKYVVIPQFPQGETSFANQVYFGKGGLLQYMSDVDRMWEKFCGQIDDYYSEVRRVSSIAVVSPQAPVLYHGVYQELSDPSQPTQDIIVPAASEDTTIRILGSFTGIYIADETTPVPPQSVEVLAFLTVALASGPYGNAGLKADCMTAYMNGKDELVNRFIMNAQSVRSRPRAFSEDSYDYGWGLYLG